MAQLFWIIALVVGVGVGYLIRKVQIASKVNSVEVRVERALEEAKNKEREILLEAKSKAIEIVDQAKKTEADFRNQILKVEERIAAYCRDHEPCELPKRQERARFQQCPYLTTRMITASFSHNNRFKCILRNLERVARRGLSAA